MTSEQTLLQEQLIGLVRRFPGRRILVVGDVIADRFVYGVISRVSREAPVLILQHEQTETLPGGAANCAVNLAAMGASVALVSAVGKDEAGQALLERLQTTGVNCQGVLLSDQLKTTTKVRILAGQLHSTRQQVIRIDHDAEPVTDPKICESIVKEIREQVKASDAVIISDYNYGVASDQVTDTIRAEAEERAIPIFADSRFRLLSFSGLTSATPNEDEIEPFLGPVHGEISRLATAADRLREELGFRALLVTRGSHGMLLLEKGVEPLNLKAVGANQPVDVTGAGDTVIATYVLALASGASFPDAARLANHAGGLVVMKRGTASITCKELEESVLHSETSS